jgi:hypothetical protein
MSRLPVPLALSLFAAACGGGEHADNLVATVDATSQDATSDTSAASDGSASSTRFGIPDSCVGLDDDQECYQLDAKTHDLDTLSEIAEVFVERTRLRLRLRPGAQTPAALAPGHVLLRGLPIGEPGRPTFLRKIESVTRSGPDVVVETTSASLETAFTDLHLHRTRQPLTFSIPVERPAAPDGMGMQFGALSSGVELVDLDCAVDIVKDTFGGVDVRVGMKTCSLVITADADIDIVVKGLKIKKAKLALSTGVELDLALIAKVSARITKQGSKSLWRFTTGAIALGPVVITVSLDIRGGYELDFDAEAKVEAQVSHHASSTIGFQYTSSGGWSTIDDKAADSELVGPTISMRGSATAKVFLKPQLEFLLYDVVGVTAWLEPYLGGSLSYEGCVSNLTSDGTPEAKDKFHYDLSIGLAAGVGVLAQIWGYTLFDQDWTLVDQSWPLDAGNYKPVIGECCEKSDCSELCGYTGCSADHQCQIDESVTCCTSDGDCDDGDVCTIDACGADGKCDHSFEDWCRCESDADCNDGDACTSDSCRECTGDNCYAEYRCRFNAVDDCESCSSDSDCDDHNSCSVDTCQTSGEGGKCSWDKREDDSCCGSDEDCSDGSYCSMDLCNYWRCEHIEGKTGTGLVCCSEDADCPENLICSGGVCAALTGFHLTELPSAP